LKEICDPRLRPTTNRSSFTLKTLTTPQKTLISIRDQLPLLRINRREVVHYEEDWVIGLIRQAAEDAGLDDPWIADDIARGILLYLRERFCYSSISIEEFFHKIQHTLRAIGFADVAGNLRQSTPPARLSLSAVAEAAGDGYELLFFQILRKRLHEAKRRGATKVLCSELRPAVTRLCEAKRWNRRCEALQTEILDYLSSALARKRKDGEVTILVR
jgi:hypothetical protein